MNNRRHGILRDKKNLITRRSDKMDVNYNEKKLLIYSSTVDGRLAKIKKKVFRIVKITLPHMAITLFMVLYVSIGSLIFNATEFDYDAKLSEVKALKVAELYERIYEETRNHCPSSESDKNFKEGVYGLLQIISEAHENRPYKINPENPTAFNSDIVQSKWSFMDGCLYALSILTTTGYVNVVPATYAGQIGTVLYGVFGIPLMVLAAVNIGRFISDIVRNINSKSTKIGHRLLKVCCCVALAASKKVSTRRRVKTELMSDDVLILNEKQSSRSTVTPSKSKLPLWGSFSILMLFNTLGAFLYMMLGDSPSTFFGAFFVCFNLVANLTMGEIPVVRDMFMFFYIVFFVTFGLAVLSACADLAASQLKWLFTYIHYFGRRMRKRKIISEFAKYCETSEELKELLSMIESIRAKYPNKHTITRQDILDYMQANEFGNNAALLRLAHRRDTIAFVPDEMACLQYADEDEVNVANEDHENVRVVISPDTAFCPIFSDDDIKTFDSIELDELEL